MKGRSNSCRCRPTAHCPFTSLDNGRCTVRMGCRACLHQVLAARRRPNEAPPQRGRAFEAGTAPSLWGGSSVERGEIFAVLQHLAIHGVGHPASVRRCKCGCNGLRRRSSAWLMQPRRRLTTRITGRPRSTARSAGVPGGAQRGRGKPLTPSTSPKLRRSTRRSGASIASRVSVIAFRPRSEVRRAGVRNCSGPTSAFGQPGVLHGAAAPRPH